MSHVPYPICPHTYPTYPAYPHIPHTRTTTHAPPPPPTYKARSDLFFRPSVRPSRVFRCSALFRSHSPVLSLYRLVRTPQPTHITHTHPYTHHTHTPHIHHIYTCTAPPAPTLASDRDRRSFPVARSLVLCSLFSFLCSVSFVHLVSFRFVSFRFGSVRFFVLDAADFGFGYMVWARSFVRDVASSPRRLWTVSHFRLFAFSLACHMPHATCSSGLSLRYLPVSRLRLRLRLAARLVSSRLAVLSFETVNLEWTLAV
ncbi:hypothetical protein L227DRAFT_233607 [Lentinus tigrinus ALCF2SS1-6]|uniref:Uncharacterized protein n=1 Tax=Lentinus tigrinus ALCF2SS1-6 TaxID=1328759 RepID=A0A5C2S1H2_9APHY|nr:hypothetical protein L227DRAFT_233607 [Lentinus tigrinus ALCF2SS1-6]